MTEQNNAVIPVPALILGLAGLIPFVGLAIFSISVDGLIRSEVIFALIAYGAVILSFLGGVHWGVALGLPEHLNWPRLIVSVVPSLLGWTALLIADYQAMTLLILSLIAMLVVDIAAARRAVFPRWYLRLRWILTAVACVSLVAALVAIR
ncbi:MAG: DUF3429 domain-containing protein [Acidiferrobacterales bacterium]|nr:DUF3429 domain-containing protein [Acidiferrobacterales bacterium]